MIKHTKTLLDGGDVEETKIASKLSFSIDGQTTNPSLIAKNPQVANRIKEGRKFSSDELNAFYKKVIQEIDTVFPGISISVEVYADTKTSAEEMVEQAIEFNVWAQNIFIKLPIIPEGLKAAKLLVSEDIKVNMTLCFTQEQAAAVYAATRGAEKGSVLVSPFVGRLDDVGLDGVSLIENIQKMYAEGDGHVEVLAASIRNVTHLERLLEINVDSITAPLKAYQEYDAEVGNDKADVNNLESIAYQNCDLDTAYEDFNIQHDLTDVGLEKFVADWKSILN